MDFSSIVVDAFVCKPFQDNVGLLVERVRWHDGGEVSTAADELERFAVVDWGARDERDGGSVALRSQEPSDGCVSAFVYVEEHDALFSSCGVCGQELSWNVFWHCVLCFVRPKGVRWR